MVKVFAWSVLFAVYTPFVLAQTPDVLQAAAEGVAAECRPHQGGSGGAGLNTTLPFELLDYLDRVSSSPFVHAYLLDHVATYGAQGHWMVKCAKTFIQTEVWEVPTLRASYLQSQTILQELRKVAENRRRDQAILGEDGDIALTSLISRALRELSTDNAEAYKGYFIDFSNRCGGTTSTLCTTLSQVIGALDTLVMEANQLREASTVLATLRDEADATRARIREAEAAALQDDIEAVNLQALLALQATREQADSAAVSPEDTVAALEQRDNSKSRLDSLRNRLTGPGGIAETMDDQAMEVNRKRQEAAEILNGIREQLRALSDIAASASLVIAAKDLTPSEGGAELVTLDARPPTAALAAEPMAAPSADLLVGLVDFVVGRAKQEIVLAYLGTVYEWVEEEPLIQTGFPQTYRLLGSLSNKFAEEKLSIGAAGRVPLNVWRATLAADFRSLPRNLINEGAPLLCAGDAACRTHLHQLRVVSEVGYRLMEGEPPLDVVSQLAVIASGSGIAPSEEWMRMVQALRIVGAVAQTYRVQGFVPAGGAERYAYVLSAESFAQSSRQLRDAFVRTLLLEAVPPGDRVPSGVDLRTLEASLAQTMRRVEALWAVLSPRNGEAVQIVTVVRTSLATARSGLALSRALSGQTAPSGWDEMTRRWEAVGEAVESMANRDYGLAMAQTTALLGSVGPRPLPRKALVLTGLAVNLAEASNGEQVQAAFEAAASPVGGWQAKRYREAKSFSLTAYPGFSGGYERLTNGEVADEGAGAVGTSLPIGLELQVLPKPSELTKRSGCALFCSVGLYVPLVDLGALLTYRLDKSATVDSEPNVSLRQVFAPGLYVSLGVGRSPLALLVGGQFMPSLREVAVPGADGAADASRTANAFRLGGAIVLDLVLFEF